MLSGLLGMRSNVSLAYVYYIERSLGLREEPIGGLRTVHEDITQSPGWPWKEAFDPRPVAGARAYSRRRRRSTGSVRSMHASLSFSVSHLQTVDS